MRDTPGETQASFDIQLQAGRDALAQGNWQEAEASFVAAVAQEPESAEAYEGLAEACWWQHREKPTFDARERAYHLYRKQGDSRGAARVATWMGADALEFKGQPAVAQGWLQRAERLLEGLEPSPEQAWLRVWMGHLALMLNNDTVAARQLAGQGIELGRKLGQIDVEGTGMAVAGLALVSEGQVQAGMKLLDEASATVVSGEMSDRNAMATIICYLMDACDRVRDYDRAAQWCTRAQELGDAWRFSALVTFCRPHYAVVLMWRGDWQEAEEQLQAANREIMDIRPLMAAEGIVRLAELRWRQGRWDEAGMLFEQVKAEGLSQLGRAELALGKGDAAEAADLAERFLRRIPDEDRIERAYGLELMVRALIALGRPEQAAGHANELKEIAALVRTEPLLGAAAFAWGQLTAARGDDEAARRCLEDAVDLFERHMAPFETARVRLELARTLQRLGRLEGAIREARAATAAFERMGATKEAQRASALLCELDPASARALATRNDVGLTPRETEVLQLIAAGRSNQEIADDLVLSVRTVERHIAGIYEKIGAAGRAARAAATAYALKNGI